MTRLKGGGRRTRFDGDHFFSSRSAHARKHVSVRAISGAHVLGTGTAVEHKLRFVVVKHGPYGEQWSVSSGDNSSKRPRRTPWSNMNAAAASTRSAAYI